MIYLDYAATTPILDEALEAMLPYQKEVFGNPSSVYAAGRGAKKGLEEARERVAGAIGALPSEIVFTGGGTEADNLAVKGAAFAQDSRGKHIITTSIEHHAVLHSVQWLARQGFRVTFLPVHRNGLVDMDALEGALSNETILVSVMLANNEVGTIQPLAEIANLVRKRSRALLHTDAVQGLGKIPVAMPGLGFDMASFAAHKLGGPKGVGALWIRHKTVIEPTLHGGGQERGMRSGTPNVAGIVGFGVAAEIAAREVETEAPRLKRLRDLLQAEILEAIPSVEVNGGDAPRLPGTLNVCIRAVEGESLLLMLDGKGIAASSGSACASGSLEPSHVLTAMGVPPDLAQGSLRFSLGRMTAEQDVRVAVSALAAVVERLRSVASSFAGRP